MICKYFLPFSRVSFHFVPVFFFCAEAFNLTYFYLFIFAFISLAWGDISRKILVRPIPKSILPLLSSMSLMASSLTFHTEMTFMYDMRLWSNFIFLHEIPLGFPMPFTEETIHSPLYIFWFFSVNYLSMYLWVYFWALDSFPLIYVFVSLPILWLV